MTGNAFDPANYPEGVPATLVAGDRWAFKFSNYSNDYPSPEYGLVWALVRQSAAGEQSDYPATVDADGVYLIEIESITTSDIVADEYFWSVRMVRQIDSATVTVDRGYVTVQPSLAGAGDVRPHTLQVLQAIRAVIEGTATKEQASYSVASRSLSRRSIEELLQLEQEYARRWRDEKDEIDRAAGRPVDSGITLIELDA